MKRDELKKILLLGENQSVEFKTSCRPNVVCRQVCAFLNSSGGYIVCGVDHKGKIVGISSEEDISAIETQLEGGLSPKALVSVELQEVDGKLVVVVEVPSGKDIPYAYKNEVFIREGERTHKADVEMIKDMVLRRQVEPVRWERRFSSADLETDLDHDEIKRTTKAVRKSSRAKFRSEENLVEVLEDLAVVKYGRLTNGGDVLFGKNPSLRHPQVRVRAACFSQDKADDTFKDMKSFDGPLGSVLEQVFNFIIRNTPTVSKFAKSDLQRHDEQLYPSEAIREGLVNAFAHRDYANFAGGIAVHIYPMRLEIWNSGCLPAGITPGTLATGHLSVLRNPDIAHVLYLRGFMEKLGRGSVMILKVCKDRGLPAPTWASDEESGVTLTFYTPQVATKGTRRGPEVAPQVTPQVTTEVAPEVMRLLAVLKGSMDRKSLQTALGLKAEKNFRLVYLRPALDSGFIEMTIPDKPRSSKQKYRLTEKGRQACDEEGAK